MGREEAVAAAALGAAAVLVWYAREKKSIAIAENPLLKQDGLPLFNKIDASHVKLAMSETLASMETEFANLEEKLATMKTPKYADIIEAMEMIEDPVEYAWGIVGHLMGVKNSDELRKVHGEMQGDVIKVSMKMSQSKVVYKALEAVSKDGWLDAAQIRIVSAYLKDMKLSGVALEGAQKETFNKNKVALSELSTKFSNQLLDANKAFTLTLTDKADVDGLPPSALALAAQRAVEGGEKGATAEAGPWKLCAQPPRAQPALVRRHARPLTPCARLARLRCSQGPRSAIVHSFDGAHQESRRAREALPQVRDTCGRRERAADRAHPAAA